ncbi:hypothetical protein DFA_03379 [Cavenderia fasciculata]|uniref:Uncharacterized protein n=1 Tax=Cavenderia fasciculata TaxID=261658 RepID=F4PHE8_CACFS|nr:uncharacterized protein DFA_03379 [Cavenderia fasciculata]EGG25132.1 hypothetical protein DFA_03379 [Cavenderia fasciculata]|eukprot:XP_004362983.1 hypothetical protein DFA_03379 [Cavenderia fasciculata]
MKGDSLLKENPKKVSTKQFNLESALHDPVFDPVQPNGGNDVKFTDDEPTSLSNYSSSTSSTSTSMSASSLSTTSNIGGELHDDNGDDDLDYYRSHVPLEAVGRDLKSFDQKLRLSVEIWVNEPLNTSSIAMNEDRSDDPGPQRDPCQNHNLNGG